MDAIVKTGLWQQFGATIDMLDNAVRACPESVWTANLWEDADDPRYGQFWFIAYHTLRSLDMYLMGTAKGFAPPAPFLLNKLPDAPYSKDEIRAYLKQCRQRCKTVIEDMTDETAHELCKFPWIEVPFLELQFYNMRHVQEHASQLNLALGQHGVKASNWVTIAYKRTAGGRT